MTVDKRIVEFNHKLLNILDEYADVITFPSIKVGEKMATDINGFPILGTNEIEFTVSFKSSKDMSTVESKITREYNNLRNNL